MAHLIALDGSPAWEILWRWEREKLTPSLPYTPFSQCWIIMRGSRDPSYIWRNQWAEWTSPSLGKWCAPENGWNPETAGMGRHIIAAWIQWQVWKLGHYLGAQYLHKPQSFAFVKLLVIKVQSFLCPPFFLVYLLKASGTKLGRVLIHSNPACWHGLLPSHFLAMQCYLTSWSHPDRCLRVLMATHPVSTWVPFSLRA